jgi:hypothetical protein
MHVLVTSWTAAMQLCSLLVTSWTAAMRLASH